MNSNNKYRNIYCGNITTNDVGKKVKIAGWINSIRNLGSLVFLTLRDETGIIQVISEDSALFEGITRESTASITGTVQRRTGETCINRVE